MKDPFFGMCRVCLKSNMTLDFDTPTVKCDNCGAKFEMIYGEWKNPGTDEAYRPAFLGKQIKE